MRFHSALGMLHKVHGGRLLAAREVIATDPKQSGCVVESGGPNKKPTISICWRRLGVVMVKASAVVERAAAQATSMMAMVVRAVTGLRVP